MSPFMKDHRGDSDLERDRGPAHANLSLAGGMNSSGPALIMRGSRVLESLMCRNIKTLYNFDPPATEAEIRASAIQFVRKLSGFNSPSKINEAAFNQAVDRVSEAAADLIGSLITLAPPKNRDA